MEGPCTDLLWILFLLEVFEGSLCILKGATVTRDAVHLIKGQARVSRYGSLVTINLLHGKVGHDKARNLGRG